MHIEPLEDTTFGATVTDIDLRDLDDDDLGRSCTRRGSSTPC